MSECVDAILLLMASKGPWSDEENDLIVSDYFSMLAAELEGKPYNKTEHRTNLKKVLNRGEPSIEYKHRNISAVLKGFGETWISGYKPAFNIQNSLIDAVGRWFDQNPDWFNRITTGSNSEKLREVSSLWVGPPPTLTNRPPPEELDQMLAIARKFDVAARDVRNRKLGRAGEKLVLHREIDNLRAAGRSDLANRVRWVSEEDGDGAGFDIWSFDFDGSDRLLEVKTTNGWERTPFHITRNEVRVAEARRSEWRLFRLHSFSRKPAAFELQPPLDRHVSLTATSFLASFN